MVIRYMEILEAVAETGTFTGAAKKLYITQSAVSHAIAELESQTGTALFDRLPRGVSLTPCGATLLKEAQRILTSCRDLDRRLKHLEEDTPVNIVSSITIASFLLPMILKELKKQAPDIQVRVRVASAAETMLALENGNADIAFSEGLELQGAFQTLLLGSYQICAACSPDFPLKDETLSPRELCSFPLLLREPGSAIRDTFDSMLSLANLKAFPVWESVNSLSLVKAAEAGLGVVILPKTLLADSLEKEKLRLIGIEGVSLANKMFATMHKDKYITRPLETLIGYLSGRFDGRFEF